MMNKQSESREYLQSNKKKTSTTYSYKNLEFSYHKNMS